MSRPRLPLAAAITLGILLLEHCSTVALTRFTQQRVGVPKPAATVSVLLTEVIKLLMSCCLELTHLYGLGNRSTPGEMYRTLTSGACAETARLSIPALLYTVQNNLIYVALSKIEMVTFQVLYQSKLLLTALLSVGCLGRRLQRIQWLALCILTAGVIMVELSEAQHAPQPHRTPLVRITKHIAAINDPVVASPPHKHGRRLAAFSRGAYLPYEMMNVRELGWTAEAGGRRLLQADESKSTTKKTLGAASVLLAATFSSIAGVYFESVVKAKERTAPSLWLRNIQLCLFTIPIALFGVGFQWDHVSEQGLLSGFDAFAWTLVILNGAGGLLVAAVIKYGDNILKNFTTSCSVILGTLISIVLFDFKPNLQFFIGATLVICSAYMYANGPDKISVFCASSEVQPETRSSISDVDESTPFTGDNKAMELDSPVSTTS